MTFPSTSTNRSSIGYKRNTSRLTLLKFIFLFISVVGLGLMVFSANFNNNTAISWQSVGGNHNGTLN